MLKYHIQVNDFKSKRRVYALSKLCGRGNVW